MSNRISTAIEHMTFALSAILEDEGYAMVTVVAPTHERVNNGQSDQMSAVMMSAHGDAQVTNGLRKITEELLTVMHAYGKKEAGEIDDEFYDAFELSQHYNAIDTLAKMFGTCCAFHFLLPLMKVQFASAICDRIAAEPDNGAFYAWRALVGSLGIDLDKSMFDQLDDLLDNRHEHTAETVQAAVDAGADPLEAIVETVGNTKLLATSEPAEVRRMLTDMINAADLLNDADINF